MFSTYPEILSESENKLQKEIIKKYSHRLKKNIFCLTCFFLSLAFVVTEVLLSIGNFFINITGFFVFILMSCVFLAHDNCFYSEPENEDEQRARIHIISSVFCIEIGLFISYIGFLYTFEIFMLGVVVILLGILVIVLSSVLTYFFYGRWLDKIV